MTEVHLDLKLISKTLSILWDFTPWHPFFLATKKYRFMFPLLPAELLQLHPMPSSRDKYRELYFTQKRTLCILLELRLKFPPHSKAVKCIPAESGC